MTQKGYKELRHDPQFTKPLMSDEEFLRGELDYKQPGMEEIERLLTAGDVTGARDTFLKRFESRAVKRFYFDVPDVPELARYARERYTNDEEALACIAEADRIAVGDLPLFKGRRVSFADGAYEWNNWLFNSSQYQLYLTRFPYLKNLSRAYAMTGDEKYARAFNQMMEHFIRDNPAPIDDAFRVQHCTWEPLTVAVRMFMLPEPFMIFFTSPSFTPEVKMLMIKFFQEHARYVQKYHAEDGNHVCMQMRGLIQVALLLPELKEAEEWLDYGLTNAPRYLASNVYDDGAQIEASPNYHLVVMRDVHELALHFKKLGIDASWYLELLAKMFNVLEHIKTPFSQLPYIGDTDVHAEGNLRDVMSLGACLLNRPDLKAFGRPELPFSLLWTVGIDEVEQYDRMEARPPEQTSAVFPIGGYITARDSWERDSLYMAMRAGIGVGGHAHADALSVNLFGYGRELIADAGIGAFEWTPERKYIVSTRAHNTVVVDGEDQHVRSFHWNTPKTADCKIWDTREMGDSFYVFASQYGYTRYEDPVIHSRKVVALRGCGWVIVDVFEADETHRYEQYFHLPAGECACDWSSNEIFTRGDGANVLLAYPDQAGSNLSVEAGLIFRNGEYMTAPVAKRAWTASGRSVTETVIVPYAGGEKPRLQVTRVPVLSHGEPLSPEEATGLRIEGEDFAYEIALYHDRYEVGAYLDHNGNPVTPALLPPPKEMEELELGGVVFRDDVHVHHCPRA
ncbi:alginate lyase family protein [Gorillibacterium timonense]|uniref:alginate lyase family protein n=1 Tax=Gorillibacterium timonense TaxID=1689269 RepID=UPI00071DFD38|nr:alginate lyase family protein [Gorillibacterium timonense]